MSLDTLNIRTRLFVLATVGLGVATIIGILALTLLRSIRADFVEYSQAAVPAQALTLKISRDMNYVSRLTRSIMLGDDHAKNMQALNERVHDIDSHFDALESAAAGVRNAAIAKQLHATIKQSRSDTQAFLSDARDRMQALAGVGNNPEALRAAWEGYHKSSTPLANNARESFRALEKLVNDDMTSIFESTERRIDGSTTMVVWLVLATLVIGFIGARIITRSVTHPIDVLRSNIEDISNSADLTRRVGMDGNNELAATSHAFDAMVERFHGIVKHLSTSATQLTTAAQQLTATSEQTNLHVQHEQGEMTQVATAMNQMTASAQEVARSAADTAKAGHSADAQARDGHDVVKQTVQAIEALAAEVEQAATVIQRLEGESASIGRVLDVIRGIAEQTNLLALNAAIEAARAGEQGRGFAVVADEVRTLASRTQQSTQEIQHMIERLQNGARDAVAVMEKGRAQARVSVQQAGEAGTALEEIAGSVARINGMTEQIAAAAEQQTKVAEEINRNLANISAAVDETVKGSQQVTRAADDLTRIAAELRGRVDEFKVHAGG